MKRMWLLVFIAIIALITPVLAYAGSGLNDNSNGDIQRAMCAGRTHIISVAESKSDYAHWQDAELVSPQSYYDLKGNLIAHMFALSKEEDVLGHVLVGSSLYNYVIFESGTGAPYALPDARKLQTLIQRDLKILTKVAEVPKPEKFVYLGYTQPFAILEISGEQIAINIDQGYAVQVDKLKSQLTPHDIYKAAIAVPKEEGTRTITYDYLSGFPWKGQLDHPWNPKYDDNPGDGTECPYCTKVIDNDCGPTCGVMVAAYYYAQGYTNFSYAASSSYPTWVGTAHHDLFDLMDTGQGHYGTYWTDLRDGWLDYAGEQGYSNFDSDGTTSDQWEVIVNTIEEDDPLVLLFWDATYAHDHFCCVDGWYQNDSQQLIEVYNPWSNYTNNPPYSRIDFVDFNQNVDDMISIWFSN